MPRPELYPVKKVIGFNREQLSAIDRWRRSQSPIPTVSDAIRQLVEQSLAATKSARRSREETSEKAAELAAQVIENLARLHLDVVLPYRSFFLGR